MVSTNNSSQKTVPARSSAGTASKGKRPTKTRSSHRKRSTSHRPKAHRPWWRRLPWWAFVAGVGVVVGYFFLLNYFFVDPFSFRWKAIYGDPDYPEGYEVRGIDISHYQERINWNKLRNARVEGHPLSFMFIKATEGISIIDENFNENFYQARQNYITRGAYHFFSPDADARKQAQFFLKQVHLEEGDLPPVLDVEKAGRLDKAQLQRAVKTWLQEVEKHYGVKPIIYTGYKFKLQYLSDDFFNDYPYWIAHYYVGQLEYKGPWAFWQYTDVGHIDGIDGYVDCNLFSGDLEALNALTIQPEQVDEIGLE